MKIALSILLFFLVSSIPVYAREDSDPWGPMGPGSKDKPKMNQSTSTSNVYKPQKTGEPVCCEVNTGMMMTRQTRKDKQSCEETGKYSKVLFQGICH